MRPLNMHLSGARAAAAVLALASGLPAGGPADRPVDFNRDIRPIFSETCLKCHGGVKQESGMSLLYRQDALAPASSGKRAVVPGKPEESELIRRVTAEDPEDRMPPKGNPLGPAAIEDLRRWIAAGAPYDDHWAFKRPVDHPPPAVSDPSWPRTGIDSFVLARLDREGLRPAPEADRHALIRRVSLDLTGLPPALEDVDAFVRDSTPGAYERLVDRLLGSPHYGERWARMWLDLARYADTQGYEKDNRRTIWRYRDWVIEAFNRDLPFDRFTIEQVAGDLLPEPSPEQLIATAFHRNTMTNTEGGTDDEEFRVAAVIDRVNTTWQVWMGSTFGCAQCHTHPYDPFRNEEYYRFLAFLNQTEDRDQPGEEPVMPSPTREQKAQADRLDASIAELRGRLEAPDPEIDAARPRWEESLRRATEWKTLSPVSLASTSGAALEAAEDGSVLAGGANPPEDTYTVTLTPGVDRIAAFRLDALTDAALPRGGPGRAEDGNFVLSRFAASIVPGDGGAVRGRHVRIDLPGKERILSLAEVQVFRGERNIAPGGAARQSSVEREGHARLAIDGNTDGRFAEARSTTRTRAEDDPWWEVDLGGPSEVSAVVVWNRTDPGVEKRLDGFRLSILDDERRPVWQAPASDAPKESLRLGPAVALPLVLKATFADHSQKEFPVEHALSGKDRKKNGWAVQPAAGKPHWAVFAPESPAGLAPGERIEVRLEHRYERPGFSLGRFRLSATDDPDALARLSAPEAVLKLVRKDPSARTAAEEAEIRKYHRSVTPALAPVRAELALVEAERQAIPIPTTPVLRELSEGKRRSTHVFIRGSFLSKGEEVKEGMPAAMHPLGDLPRNRLGLARWLVHPDNPLTARVTVNRFWEQLFGLGLVETSEDFGTQGSPPSHPELLDWLALRFMREHAFSPKKLLREIVTSAIYRQSSRALPELLERDARNRLLARGPRFRLEAELIRDQALAASGLLSPKMLGPSVMPHQPEGVWQVVYSGDAWVTSPGEDRHRRSLYTFWRRTSPYPSLMAFDATSREFCVARRIRTNTPLQALVTLNDPVHVEAAQALARRAQRALGPGAGPAEKAALAFRHCLARPPEPRELERLVALYRSEVERYKEDREAARKMATEPLGPAPEGADLADLAALTVVSNVILNLDEFLTRG